MKIIHMLPSLSSGGVEQVVLELCEGLQASGAQNIVISSGGSMVAAIEATGARHICMPVHRKSPSTLLQIAPLRRLLLEEKPEILHLHSRVPAWLGQLCCKTLPPDARPAIVSSFHGFHSVNAYSAIMSKGDAIIAVSQSMRQHILDNYPSCPESSISVIPNSVDTSLNYPTYRPSNQWLQQWYADYPESEGKFTLCLPGRITQLKGANMLVPLLDLLHAKSIPAHAVIVGECKPGKEAYKEKLKEQFAQHKLSNHISWTGHRHDLRDILSSCDVTLSLTLQPESFGKTTLEALALGRPVAGWDHGGVGEQLDIFLPEGKVTIPDIEQLAELLASWYSAPPSPKLPLPAPYRREDMLRSHLLLYQQVAEL